MNRDEFYNFLQEEYEFDDRDALKLIDNILQYVESHHVDYDEQHSVLCDLFRCVVPLSYIKNVYL